MPDNKYASLDSLKAFLDNLKVMMDNHNTATVSHNDIRTKIEDVNTRLTTLADCDDETLDQISEIVEYVKDNRELIEIITTAKVSVSDLLNLVYPIGSIYMSVNNISPSTFLGGTWERIENTFLLAAGSNYIAGSTGGEAYHTLTANEMPAHYHGAIEDLVPDATEYNNYYFQMARHLDSKSTARRLLARGEDLYAITADPATSDYGSSRDINTANRTGTTGGGLEHNNMPPYLTVYMWKRTA